MDAVGIKNCSRRRRPVRHLSGHPNTPLASADASDWMLKTITMNADVAAHRFSQPNANRARHDDSCPAARNQLVRMLVCSVLAALTDGLSNHCPFWMSDVLAKEKNNDQRNKEQDSTK